MDYIVNNTTIIPHGDADSLTPGERLLQLRLDVARKQRDTARTIVARGSWEGPIPLSFAQERLWFLDQLGLVGIAYNITTVLRLIGGLDYDTLERSLRELVQRHEILRTRFDAREGVPHQLVAPAIPVELNRIDLSDIANRKNREGELREFIQREQQHKFVLRQLPLIRVALAKLSPLEHALVITLHHIISDGWSTEVFARDLGVLYSAFFCGGANPLPELTLQYADYAIWQRQWLQGAVLQSQLEYWIDRLRGAPAQLQLPTDRPRPTVESFKGGMLPFEVPPAVSTALTEFARNEKATVFMVLLAAYQLLLSRWSGQPDIVVGCPIAGRKTPEIEGLIGFFVNTLVLRVGVSGDLTFRALLARVKDETLSAYAHQDLPFERLVKELRPERNLTRQPLFQVVLALQNYPEHEVELSGLTWKWGGVEYATTHFDLTLYVYNRVDGLSAVFEYATDLFDKDTIIRMSRHFRILLDEALTHPDRPICELALLSDAERHQLIHTFNATAVSLPNARPVHEQFEAQVRRSPKAVAVVQADRSLTYEQIDTRANQLAKYLKLRGISPDRLVGIYLQRSPELLVCMLGILKAGGAYVPLDPAHPTERLAHMLRDAAPTIVLTQRGLNENLNLPGLDFELILMDEGLSQVDRQSSADFQPANPTLHPRQLAYVIYTSGSTGEPKGVSVEHGSLTNLVCWHINSFGLTAGKRSSSMAGLGFDASTWEIWPTVCSGGVLLLPPSDLQSNPDSQLRWWRQQELDVSFLVTPIAETAYETGFVNIGLKTLLVGGARLGKWPKALPHSQRLVNNYGPTEATVVATSGTLHDSDIVLHIGKPIANARTYILDSRLQPVPIGVPGELYIGGDCVARGYLNKPGMTAERFLPDPFSAETTGRIYKSGDLGRWRGDGTIEYMGRNDDQLKLRGVRIEPGEIAAQLLRHPQVKDAVVVPHEDEAGKSLLIGYVVPSVAPRDSKQKMHRDVGIEMVSQWRRLYDTTYSAGVSDPSFVGWTSSYTAESIPESEMQEWLRNTVSRIAALHPSRVLEIGCGVGLLVQHLAKGRSVYVGTDLSASAIDQLQAWVGTREGLEHVRLLNRSASELHDLDACSFDTVVLNSVIQYFPDIEYLLAVLRDTVRMTRTGGKLFIGDVRHLGMLPMFHSAVQLSKATATVRIAQLKKRIARAVAQDKELVIDPQFFLALPGNLPGISAAEVHLKRGYGANELLRYRYDVILHVDDQVAPRPRAQRVGWRPDIGSIGELTTALKERRWAAAYLHSVPNQRIARDAASQRLIEVSDERMDVGALRLQLNETLFADVDPETIWALAEAHGYDAAVIPGEPGYFDVQLLDRTRLDEVPRVAPAVGHVKDWSTYANDPLENGFRQQFIPQLRDYLKGRLPEYMIPSAWIVLKQLPLNPSGKLDRKALPLPEGRPEELGEYVPPRTELERKLTNIWVQLLPVDQVGIDDNFFELGGHSLLATRVLSRMCDELVVDLPIIALFEAPTVRQLSSRVEREKAEQDTLWTNNVTRDLSRDIDAMNDEEILVQIAQLKTQLPPPKAVDD